MNLQVDVERLLLAQKSLRAELLAERATSGHWVGQVASSPLATAAAISALVAAHQADTRDLLSDDASALAEAAADRVVRGDLCEFLVESVNWLAGSQNPDGGWGDCVGGKSTIAATMLVQAAFRLTGVPAKYDDLILRADHFVEAAGGISALRQQYRDDKPHLAAVLATCALAGTIAWNKVPTLQFEQYCLPARLQGYWPASATCTSLPLVLAVGRAKFQLDPPRNPLMRVLRRSVRAKGLALLAEMQATDDSFSASISTTAFVVLCLSSSGCQNHSIVERGVEFLLSSVRSDASWPVVMNLANRVTTLALSNLSEHEAIGCSWHASPSEETSTQAETSTSATSDHTSSSEPYAGENVFSDETLDWLLGSQHTEQNSITRSAAGGWAASDSQGALPNTWDTANVLLALARWPHVADYPRRSRMERTVELGTSWLLDAQSEAGGWTSFGEVSDCRPEEVGADTTARVLYALASWRQHLPSSQTTRGDFHPRTARTARIESALESGWRFLERAQRPDGSFSSLWFGNEHHPEDENFVMGTAEVLHACVAMDRKDSEVARRATRWLVASQHAGGGWGPPRAPVDYSGADKEGYRAWRANDLMAKFCSVEETATAVSALMPWFDSNPAISKAVSVGLTWLVNAIEQDLHRRPAVLGFYPSGIWYHEQLYPLAFAAGVFSRATHRLALDRPTAATVN